MGDPSPLDKITDYAAPFLPSRSRCKKPTPRRNPIITQKTWMMDPLGAARRREADRGAQAEKIQGRALALSVARTRLRMREFTTKGGPFTGLARMRRRGASCITFLFYRLRETLKLPDDLNERSQT